MPINHTLTSSGIDWRTVVLASRSCSFSSGSESKAALSGAKMVMLVLVVRRMSSWEDLRAAASLLSLADLERISSTEQVASQGGTSLGLEEEEEEEGGKVMLRLPIRGWRNPATWAAARPLGVRLLGLRAGLERGCRTRARSVSSELTEVLSWTVGRNKVRMVSMAGSGLVD